MCHAILGYNSNPHKSSILCLLLMEEFFFKRTCKNGRWTCVAMTWLTEWKCYSIASQILLLQSKPSSIKDKGELPVEWESFSVFWGCILERSEHLSAGGKQKKTCGHTKTEWGCNRPRHEQGPDQDTELQAQLTWLLLKYTAGRPSKVGLLFNSTISLVGVHLKYLKWLRCKFHILCLWPQVCGWGSKKGNANRCRPGWALSHFLFTDRSLWTEARAALSLLRSCGVTSVGSQESSLVGWAWWWRSELTQPAKSSFSSSTTSPCCPGKVTQLEQNPDGNNPLFHIGSTTGWLSKDIVWNVTIYTRTKERGKQKKKERWDLYA